MKNGILLLFLCLVACESESRKTHEIISINIEDARIVKTSEFAIGVNLVPLGLSGNPTIADVSKLVCSDDFVIIFDRFQSKVFVSDWGGRIISVIDKLGQGPGEYSSIRNIVYNKFDDAIVIHDQISGRLLNYSLPDGEFLSSIRIPYIIEDFICVKGGYLFYSPNEQNIDPENNTSIDYGIFEVDLNGSFTRHVLKVGGSDKEIFSPNSIQNICNNDGISFLPAFFDSIYFYKNHTFDVKYSIDFGKNTLPDSYRYNDYSTKESVFRFVDSDYVHSKFYYLNDNDFFYFMYVIKQKGSGFIYFKNSRETVNFSGIVDDFNKIVLFPPTAVHNGKLVGALPSDQNEMYLSILLKNSDFTENEINEYQDSITNLFDDELSNPILFTINLKIY